MLRVPKLNTKKQTKYQTRSRDPILVITKNSSPNSIARHSSPEASKITQNNHSNLAKYNTNSVESALFKTTSDFATGNIDTNFVKPPICVQTEELPHNNHDFDFNGVTDFAYKYKTMHDIQKDEETTYETYVPPDSPSRLRERTQESVKTIYKNPQDFEVPERIKKLRRQDLSPLNVAKSCLLRRQRKRSPEEWKKIFYESERKVLKIYKEREKTDSGYMEKLKKEQIKYERFLKLRQFKNFKSDGKLKINILGRDKGVRKRPGSGKGSKSGFLGNKKSQGLFFGDKNDFKSFDESGLGVRKSQAKKKNNQKNGAKDISLGNLDAQSNSNSKIYPEAQKREMSLNNLKLSVIEDVGSESSQNSSYDHQDNPEPILQEATRAASPKDPKSTGIRSRMTLEKYRVLRSIIKRTNQNQGPLKGFNIGPKNSSKKLKKIIFAKNQNFAKRSRSSQKIRSTSQNQSTIHKEFLRYSKSSKLMKKSIKFDKAKKSKTRAILKMIQANTAQQHLLRLRQMGALVEEESPRFGRKRLIKVPKLVNAGRRKGNSKFFRRVKLKSILGFDGQSDEIQEVDYSQMTQEEKFYEKISIMLKSTPVDKIKLEEELQAQLLEGSVERQNVRNLEAWDETVKSRDLRLKRMKKALDMF